MAKRGTLHHPKLYVLADALGLDRACCLGILEGLWHYTAAYRQNGDLSGVNPYSICKHIGYSGDPEMLWEKLGQTGWLDIDGDDVRIHDWLDHCDDATKKRIARAQSDPAADNGGKRRTTADDGRQRQTTAAVGGQNPPRAWPQPKPEPEPKPEPAAALPACAREGPPPDPPPPPASGRVPDQIEARLIETGVSPEQLADVIALPQGAEIITLQLEWLPHRGNVTSPAGMLVAACRGAARGDPRWTTAPGKLQAKAAEADRARQAAERSLRLQSSQEAERLSPIRRRLDALPEVARDHWLSMVRRASPWLGGLLAAAAPDPHPDRLVVLTLSRTACQALTRHREELERLAGLPVSVSVIETAAEEAA